MIKIFKQLGRHWQMCLAVVALLLVQAYCDLSLPAYTSSIVDVGIQQGGIESPLPETIRPQTLDALVLVEQQRNPDSAAALQNAYTDSAQTDGVLALRDDLTDEQRAALEAAVPLPEAVLYRAAAAAATAGNPASAAASATETVTPAAADLDGVTALLAAQGVPPELSAQLAALQTMDTETMQALTSQGVLFVALEYAGQGVAESVQMSYLLTAGGKMLLLTLLMVAAAILVGLLASRVSAAIGRDMRHDVFTRVVSFSNNEIDKFSTASLITRTTNDIQQVQFVCVILLRMVAYAPILGLGGIWRVAQSGSGLTWIVFLAVAALLILIATLMIIAMPKFKLMQTLVDKLNLVSREILTGIMPIRAFSREAHEEARFDTANTNLMRTQLFTNRVMACMMPCMMLIMNGVTLLIVWFGGHAIEAGTMQVGAMIAFITYAMQIVMSFLMLAMVAVMLPRAGVAADRIEEVLATPSTLNDPPAEVAEKIKERTDWPGVVRFDNVCYRYPGADEDAIEQISFTAKPGQTTAIIGSTGCGKTTLLNLIPRFYDATGGHVTIDGVDVRDMPQHTLHELLGYVPQKGVLFSGTIESNLKFGGDHITDAAMQQAASIAQATDFICAKQEGYQSPIAQGGSNVSGGQKQRLSIARAIAKKPRIYLFDDSFSALDYKTDVTLRRALKNETDNATVIIVAQRISTVLHANQILVLDDGKLVGAGTHARLMETCPEYQEIAKSQLSQKELNLKGGE